MKNIFKIILLCAAVVAAAACSKSRAEQMKLAENVQIQCNPEVLALVGDQIPVDLTVTYPDGYFHPKAILEVTPVLVYGGGEEQKGPTFVYQGEKVLDNFKVVYKAGGTVKEHFAFKYDEGVEQAYLELRGVARIKDKEIAIPAVKVADGTIVTQLLAETEGYYSYKKDNYQAVLHEQTEGQVMYDYNSSTIKNSELRSQSIKELQAALAAIEADPRYTVTGTSIVAYASPEGGQTYNAKLSDQRAASAERAWSKVTGEKDAPDNLEIRSIGQDWEGFREAVAKSNIQDKDLILRVLSMYSDPAVRESEIRNMSQIYSEINKRVFPELRRARLVTSTEFRNYDDDELVEMAEKKGLDRFDEPSVLRLAAIAKTTESKETLYKYAISKFNSDTARYNLAMLYLDEGKTSLGGAYLSKIKEPDADVLNATGVVAMRNGDWDLASKCFEQAGDKRSRENFGLMNIIRGDYATAAKAFSASKGDNAAIANILNGDLKAAEAALEGDGARTDYLRAIIAARKGEVSEARKLLDAACAADSALKERSINDIEFAALAN